MVYHIQKKIWKHFRPKNFSTYTNNPTSEIQIAPFLILDGKQHTKKIWFHGC